MSRLKEVLAFVNNKGGVAKTTSAVCLASALVRERQELRVLVIDLDSQCNASMLLGWDETKQGDTVYDALSQQKPLSVYETTAKRYNDNGGVFLCPGHKYMSGIDTALRLQRPAEKVLLKCFANPIADNTSCNLGDDIAEAFDYILIDCPPALGDITFNAMMVTDGVIIPVKPSRLAADALTKSIAAFKECQKDMHPELQFRGILITIVDDRSSVVKEYVNYIRETYGEAVFKTQIRETAKLEESHALGRDLYDYKPYCNTGMDYTNLAKEILGIN